MIQYRELIQTFRSLPISEHQPVLLHISDSTAETIQGGKKTLIGTLKGVFPSLMMPAFTYQTMVFPKKGPKDNGVEYNNPPIDNREAVFFHPHLPVSEEAGVIPEAFRKLPDVTRSTHPILSFSGINVDQALNAQTLSSPYAPIDTLAKRKGWVLLIDRDQTANFTIHYALHKGGRKLFTRWALTPAGVKTCPHFPGCKEGFHKIDPYLREDKHRRQIQAIQILAFPMRSILKKVSTLLKSDPFALLCEQEHCLACASIRARHNEGSLP